jgi:hypothetical protein
MSLQAICGVRSFNCRVGEYVWVKCLEDGCKTLVRVKRDEADEREYYCGADCYFRETGEL